ADRPVSETPASAETDRRRDTETPATAARSAAPARTARPWSGGYGGGSPSSSARPASEYCQDKGQSAPQHRLRNPLNTTSGGSTRSNKTYKCLIYNVFYFLLSESSGRT